MSPFFHFHTRSDDWTKGGGRLPARSRRYTARGRSWCTCTWWRTSRLRKTCRGPPRRLEPTRSSRCGRSPWRRGRRRAWNPELSRLASVAVESCHGAAIGCRILFRFTKKDRGKCLHSFFIVKFSQFFYILVHKKAIQLWLTFQTTSPNWNRKKYRNI